jgi:hypothetical protein
LFPAATILAALDDGSARALTNLRRTSLRRRKYYALERIRIVVHVNQAAIARAGPARQIFSEARNHSRHGDLDWHIGAERTFARDAAQRSSGGRNLWSCGESKSRFG